MTTRPGTLARGRVVAAGAAAMEPLAPPAEARDDTLVGPGRLVPKVLVDASIRAEAVTLAAERRAEEIVRAAREAAEGARGDAEREGRAAGEAALAAAWLRVRSEEAARDEAALERTVAAARLVAERLVGDALAADDAKVIALARQALASLRRARRIAIEANAEDAAILRRELPSLGVDAAAVTVHAAADLARGSLRVVTDLGRLDATLAPQLDRLLAALRVALRG